MFNIRQLEPCRVSLKNKTFVINLMIDDVSQSFDKSRIYWNSPINLELRVGLAYKALIHLKIGMHWNSIFGLNEYIIYYIIDKRIWNVDHPHKGLNIKKLEFPVLQIVKPAEVWQQFLTSDMSNTFNNQHPG